MKNIIVTLALAITSVFFVSSIAAASPETEKNFMDSYKKAFESKDEATLKGFLYTKGADPEALEFYTMMMTSDMGGKISSIELRPLNPEETKRALETMPMPNGGVAKLPVNPTRKLVLKIDHSDANGTSSSSSESFVAEVDGKFVIPVPVPVK